MAKVVQDSPAGKDDENRRIKKDNRTREGGMLKG